MRQCVIAATIGSEETRSEGLAENDESLTEMLWLAYLMMLENDGLNYEQLCWAQLHSFLALHHASEMLDGAVQAGYPSDAVHKALALHLIYLLTDPEQLAFEPKGEAVERLFVLRPFVFAAHKFDAYLAPWTLRNLPLSNHSNLSNGNNSNGAGSGEEAAAQNGQNGNGVGGHWRRILSLQISHHAIAAALSIMLADPFASLLLSSPRAHASLSS